MNDRAATCCEVPTSSNNTTVHHELSLACDGAAVAKLSHSVAVDCACSFSAGSREGLWSKTRPQISQLPSIYSARLAFCLFFVPWKNGGRIGNLRNEQNRYPVETVVKSKWTNLKQRSSESVILPGFPKGFSAILTHVIIVCSQVDDWVEKLVLLSGLLLF